MNEVIQLGEVSTVIFCCLIFCSLIFCRRCLFSLSSFIAMKFDYALAKHVS